MKTMMSFYLCLLCANIVWGQQKNIPTDVLALSYQDLDSTMLAYYEKGSYEDCLYYMHAALEKATKEFGEADSTYSEYVANVGFFYNALGQNEQAEIYYKKAVDVRKKLYGEKHPLYATALNNLGSLCQDVGNFEAAKSYYETAIAIRKEVLGETNLDYASSINNLASLYQEKAKYEEAEPLFLLSIKIKKATLETRPVEYANALNNLAVLYQNMSRYEEAEPLLLESKDLRKKHLGEAHPYYANSLNNLAALYRDLGKLEQCEQLYLQARDIRKSVLGEQHPHYAHALNNLAGVYRKIDKKEAAEKLYLEAKAIYKVAYGEQHSYYAYALNNLASLYRELQQFEQAEVLYKQALGIYKKEKGYGVNHPEYATSLSNLAGLYDKAGNYNETEKLYLEAAKIRKNALGETHDDYADALSNLANVYRKKKQFSLAISYANQAILAMCKTCDTTAALNLNLLPQQEFYARQSVINALYEIQRIAESQAAHFKDDNYLKEGYVALKVAIQLNESVRNSFTSNQDKLRSLEEMHRMTKDAIYMGTALSAPNDKRYLLESFNYAEQNKSVLLAEALKGQRARSLTDLPDSLALKELSMQQEKKELQKAEFEAKDEQRKKEIRAQKNDLDQKINVFLKDLKQKYPQYHHLKYQNISAQATDIQQLLGAKTMLLEYFIADTIVYVFSITQDEVSMHPFSISKDSLNDKIALLRNALSNYMFLIKKEKEAYFQYTNAAHWFYKVLVAPMLKGKAIEKIILISDGNLGHLPFESFLVEPAGQDVGNYKDLHYLVKDFDISYNYSATLWKENKEYLSNGNLAKRHVNNHQFLACASAYSPQDSSIFERRENSIAKLRMSLQALPAAQNEVAALSEKFEGLFLQNDSTNEAFFKENAAQYGVIHLAMHGILHPRVPMLSSLAFTENGDSLEDNFLQAYEISHLKLNADLIVLSACETGYGKFEQGEGVISLARSFMYAGSPSLVVSLWQVNDASTAYLMGAFYQNLAEGMPKDVALRAAKLLYIQHAEGVLAHPAFWSPFIQLGDDRPIQIYQKGSGNFWWIGGGIILGLLAVIMMYRRKKRAQS